MSIVDFTTFLSHTCLLILTKMEPSYLYREGWIEENEREREGIDTKEKKRKKVGDTKSIKLRKVEKEKNSEKEAEI